MAMYENCTMCGPYVSKKDGRLVCTIYNKITKRVTTTTYPRYVYQKHYNKIIPKGVSVFNVLNELKK